MNPDRYGEFFQAIHGYEPFPWQRRLVSQVVERGEWPRSIALPTSAGKTSVIEIAVFALACDAARHAAKRLAPRRIFFVVDRRIVVDEAYARAHRLARLLVEAHSGVLREAAQLLASLGGDVPLAVAAMRGGMYLDQTWTRSPAQPVVCVSTVDQLGSRLLFRGYGLALGVRNTLPVHAGLVGNDALIVLDEAHISRPFADTLAALERYRAWAEQDIAARGPWHAVRMSATLEDGDAFREDEADRNDHELGKRLAACKLATLVEVPAATDDEAERRAKLVEEACARVLALHEADPGARVLGVVVNRVATARDVFEALRERIESVLLIGPSRPYDRDRILRRILPRIRAGRKRGADDAPLVVVATQCIEVGADLDFDALVSEAAPVDALRQRFGRLDRLGERGDTRAFVLIRRDHAEKKFVDPVYGSALARSWAWLSEGAGRRKEADMGIDALGVRLPRGEELRELCSPSPNAPVLLPAHLDLWAQTSPIPVPDPEVSLFLHGPEAGPPDVQVVWRADLDRARPDKWMDVVALVPPSTHEALAIPVYAVRRWLERARTGEIADVEGVGDEEAASEAASPDGARRAMRWRGLEESEIVVPTGIRPGDTIVVPASYGGADAFGWNPGAEREVQDVGDAAALERRARAVLRVHPSLVSSWFDESANDAGVAAQLVGRLTRAPSDDDGAAIAAEDELLEFLSSSDAATDWASRAARLLRADGRRRTPYPDGSGLVLVGARPLQRRSGPGELADEFAPEDEASSLAGRPVSLRAHTSGVVEWVRQFAAALSFPAALAEDLALAAELHDLGKADPRFQVLLHGGDEVAAALADELLAKSGMSPQDRTAARRARERAGYPSGYRHETASLALAQRSDRLRDRASDLDLVLHLVASHHGCARPFIPVVSDPEPVVVSVQDDGEELASSSAHGLERLDSGVADRFWRLARRYGWYGLAYVEAVLRVADQRRSEEEQRGP